MMLLVGDTFFEAINGNILLCDHGFYTNWVIIIYDWQTIGNGDISIRRGNCFYKL